MQLFISVISMILNISTIHNDLESIMKSEERLDFHIKNISNTSSPEMIAYRGLFKTAYAEHVFWPMTKLSYFNEGKDEIEGQIQNHPDITELYFIRLLVQLNAPSFLGYSDDIDGDFYKVVKCENVDLRTYMTDNLNKLESLNETQKLILKNIN